MVLQIDSIPEHLGSWSEGCACHETYLRAGNFRTHHQREVELRRLCGTGGSYEHVGGAGCRMAGKRAWELACGRAPGIIRHQAECGLCELRQDLRPTLNEAQWQVIEEDFHVARCHIETQNCNKSFIIGKHFLGASAAWLHRILLVLDKLLCMPFVSSNPMVIYPPAHTIV